MHILASKYGKTLNSDDAVSIAKHQYYEARKRIENKPGQYKIFIWYPPEILIMPKDDLQEKFISEIRNSIIKNMIFSNVDSSIQFVDDIRSLMATEEKTTFDINNTDLFLIFNQIDENEANEIIDMLSDIVDVTKLNIVQYSDMDYSEYCVQKIGRSKLVTVYFKQTADWALPFTQQIWKKVGGASTHTPILLIGDDDPESNINKKFDAPKVVSLIIAGELIPLEIKVQYDTAVETASI